MARATKKSQGGIYPTPYGYRAIVNTAVGRKEKRFKPDATAAAMKKWRQETIGKFAAVQRRAPATDAPIRGTLAADVRRYLKGLSIPSKASRESDLKAWVAIPALAKLPRRRITPEHCRAAVRTWTDADVSGWTIRHRVHALRALWRWADGRDAPTPVDDLELGQKPAPQPTYVPPDTILKVAKALRASQDSKTLGRFLVLVTTGVRPIELQRATEADVDLKARVWIVRTAKGGPARPIRLNTAEMLRAWRTFIAAGAWGKYDSTLFTRKLRRGGWPAKVRPYALRGTWGMELSMGGADLRDIQTLMGHKDIETTGVYYVPPIDARLNAATKTTARRFKGQLPTLKRA